MIYPSAFSVAEERKQHWQIQVDKEIIKDICQFAKFPEQPENHGSAPSTSAPRSKHQIHSGLSPVRNPFSIPLETDSVVHSSDSGLCFQNIAAALDAAATAILMRMNSAWAVLLIRAGPHTCALAATLGTEGGDESLPLAVSGVEHGSCLIR